MSFFISKSAFFHKLVVSSYIPVRYAARKGTRERKQKKKVVKVVEERVKFIPHNQRKKDQMLANRPKLKFDDSWKRDPVDDVYFMRYYKWDVHPFVDGAQMHKETHHPDMYNEPNAPLHVRMELNMQGERITRFVEDFKRIVAIPSKFEHGEERSVIAFTKDVGLQKESVAAGAQLGGGVELIKQIQSGTVNLQEFQFIIAHPDILPELVPLRGLMKKRFPSSRHGTLDVDLVAVTHRFLNGITYSAKKDEHEKDFGLVEVVIGNLGMSNEDLEGNFKALVQDVYSMRPKREGHFISRCLLWSPPSPEQFKVDHSVYIEGESQNEAEKDEEVGERVAL